MTEVAVDGTAWRVPPDEPARAAAFVALQDWLDSLPAGARRPLIIRAAPVPPAEQEALVRRAAAGEPVLLVGPARSMLAAGDPLAAAAGLLPGPLTPAHEVRVRRGPAVGGVGARLGELRLRLVVPLVEKVAEDVQILLTATVGLTEHPLVTVRPRTNVATCAFDALEDPRVRRLVHLLLWRLTEQPESPAVRVGLLGYGAIGHEHSRAVTAVEGLELAAVCDRSPERLSVARALVPDVRVTSDADELLRSDDIDLIVISTPPDSHGAWARRALRAGKHVVVEKPFTLTSDEADAVVSLAAERGLTAVAYQNRRFDPDYLALRRLVDDGALGEVFHLEAFVGGYSHPCNYWHSDEGISGGAIYDWGAHVLDQVLDLMPQEIAHVTAAEHKRVWHDVSNADHSRVTIRFIDGAEAEFVHSDLAAAMKPRWYVLGTRAAVVGHWRTERVIGRSDIGTLAEDVLAPADAPPALTFHAADGSVTALATPAGPANAFHTELADALLTGLPMRITGAQARRVVAVMQAARASALSGGRPVVPA